MMARTISTGQLHLQVHTLLGSHRESVSKRVRDRARTQLEIDHRTATTLQLATMERCPCPFNTGDPDTDKPCTNEHARALADQQRLARALARTYEPIRPGKGLLLQALNPHLRILSVAGDPYAPSGKPSSRPPTGAGLNGLDLIRKVQDRTGLLRHRIHTELGTPHRLLPWQKALWDLPSLAEQLRPGEVREQLLHDLDRDLTSWVNASRVLLGHVAAMVTLTTPCPHCEQTSLIVREDATSDVVCVTDDCVDEQGQQSRWGRIHWKALLEGRYATGLVNTEAAALHLGVTAATIRDWKRRGLIMPAADPTGVPLGTSRQPFWRLAELLEAAVASKPRRTA